MDEQIGRNLWAPPRAARQAVWAKRAATSLAEAGRWGLAGGAFIYVKAQGGRLAQIYNAGAHQGKSTTLAAEGGPYWESAKCGGPQSAVTQQKHHSNWCGGGPTRKHQLRMATGEKRAAATKSQRWLAGKPAVPAKRQLRLVSERPVRQSIYQFESQAL